MEQLENRASKAIRDAFESGRPLLYVRTSEEARVTKLITAASSAPVWTWSVTDGLVNPAGGRSPGTESARVALNCIIAHEGAALFHLKDFHDSLRDSPEVRRRLRDAYYACLDHGKHIIITSPVRFIPEELERNLVFLELRPPDLVEISAFLKETVPGVSDDTIARVAPALQGLTLEESGYALRRALMASPQLGPESLPVLLEEKHLLVSRTGVLEFISAGRQIDEIGGLENLKRWLLERRKLFLQRDTVNAEIVPKGVLLMGIPGCGKSLCIKAISSAFNLPLYRIDMVEVFSGRHGNAEGAFVQACKMMEDLAPAVLWFDEIEMGITSTESSGEQGRIFAFFLTWMQEKTAGLFIAATANRIDLLPAEMIRKGRFDEVFFVDLPLETEQLDIFKIHLSRRGVDWSGFNLPQILKLTNGWSGAEIEQCVISAVTRARLAERELTETDPGGRSRKVRAALPHHERTDQPDSRMGVRAGGSRFPAPRALVQAIGYRGKMRPVAVIGIGKTPFGAFADQTLLSLAVAAGEKCFRDSGIWPSQVESFYLGNFAGPSFTGQNHLAPYVATALGMRFIPATRVENACASSGSAFYLAHNEVASGHCDIAMVVGVEKMTSQQTPRVTEILAAAGDCSTEIAAGSTFPSLFGMIARRHMYQYGTKREHLAAVAVKNHENGALNPDAQMKKVITLEQAMAGKPIADPLNLYDCSLISDGAAAVILAPLERAREWTDQAIRVRGIAQAADYLALDQKEDITTFPSLRSAAQKAYAQAGLDRHRSTLRSCTTVSRLPKLWRWKIWASAIAGRVASFQRLGKHGAREGSPLTQVVA